MGWVNLIWSSMIIGWLVSGTLIHAPDETKFSVSSKSIIFTQGPLNVLDHIISNWVELLPRHAMSNAS